MPVIYRPHVSIWIIYPQQADQFQVVTIGGRIKSTGKSFRLIGGKLLMFFRQ